MDAQRLAEVATALGSETRAEIVCALLSGGAHTGRELSRHLSVAPSTTSEHLGRLVAAGLVSVESQGRHRYFRLAGPEVAILVEGLLGTAAPVAPVPTPRVPHGLAFARSCYDHLAGELGVRLCDRLVELDAVAVGDDGAELTTSGRGLLRDLGIGDLATTRARPTVRLCLDWSQRRHHLAGAVGARLLTTMLERGWLSARSGTRRELRLSRTGRHGLDAELGLRIGGTT